MQQTIRTEIDIREAGLLVSTGQIENGLKLADKVVHASPDSALFLTVAADLNHSYNHEKELQYLKAALEIRQKGPENGFPDLNYIKTACAIRLPLPRSARQTSK